MAIGQRSNVMTFPDAGWLYRAAGWLLLGMVTRWDPNNAHHAASVGLLERPAEPCSTMLMLSFSSQALTFH